MKRNARVLVIFVYAIVVCGWAFAKGPPPSPPTQRPPQGQPTRAVKNVKPADPIKNGQLHSEYDKGRVPLRVNGFAKNKKALPRDNRGNIVIVIRSVTYVIPEDISDDQSRIMQEKILQQMRQQASSIEDYMMRSSAFFQIAQCSDSYLDIQESSLAAKMLKDDVLRTEGLCNIASCTGSYYDVSDAFESALKIENSRKRETAIIRVGEVAFYYGHLNLAEKIANEIPSLDKRNLALQNIAKAKEYQSRE